MFWYLYYEDYRTKNQLFLNWTYHLKVTKNSSVLFRLLFLTICLLYCCLLSFTLGNVLINFSTNKLIKHFPMPCFTHIKSFLEKFSSDFFSNYEKIKLPGEGTGGALGFIRVTTSWRGTQADVSKTRLCDISHKVTSDTTHIVSR